MALHSGMTVIRPRPPRKVPPNALLAVHLGGFRFPLSVAQASSLCSPNFLEAGEGLVQLMDQLH
jgi:hypothetical protein